MQKYKYLSQGVVITSDGRDNEKIKIRMEKPEIRSPISNRIQGSQYPERLRTKVLHCYMYGR